MIGKKFLPKSLFGRALLILVLPTVLIQLVTAFIFFDRHWENVMRHMAGTLAGETAFLVHQLETMPPERQSQIARDFDESTGIYVFSDTLASFKPRYETSEFPEFQERLRARIDNPFTVRTIDGGNTIEIRIRLKTQVLRLETTVKRLESRTTTLFVLWMLGASALFLLIAVIFLRNQIRPIRKLAEAADSFGRGVDITDFRPSGADEVRKAARAFIIMRERIRRQLRTRTEMLAGISHDLRTPLTRMKLQLAMLSDPEAKEEFNNDVQQMEHMIQEYLDFARGEGREEAVRVSLRELMESMVSDYARMNAEVTLAPGSDTQMSLRISGVRRMLHNLIDNALRYGKRCVLTLRVASNFCEIFIDDEGPGIPVEKREEVFKPFSRLEASRNVKTGGVGLGLTIARDIAQAHGGGVTLAGAPGGGLRVIVRLPL
ncbi:MAG: HAMP domain-containing protein [Pseudomonadota bacterium]|nr:HAMP domain-containing protein [Pseudomonadota bacterium]MDE3037342.1 HAMP domain-containing protein [Pseudomonadota bacterium]